MNHSDATHFPCGIERAGYEDDPNEHVGNCQYCDPYYDGIAAFNVRVIGTLHDRADAHREAASLAWTPDKAYRLALAHELEEMAKILEGAK